MTGLPLKKRLFSLAESEISRDFVQQVVQSWVDVTITGFETPWNLCV